MEEIIYRGFIEQLSAIFTILPQTARCVVATTSMTHEITNYKTKYMENAVEIKIANEHVILRNNKQYNALVTDSKSKLDIVAGICIKYAAKNAGVICNSKIKQLEENMKKIGLLSTVIRKEPEIGEEVKAFVKEKLFILPEAALAKVNEKRGIEVLVNYEMPDSKEGYLDRIVKVHSATRKLMMINLVSPSEAGLLKEIVKEYNTNIDLLDLNQLQ
eukprot:TRINITY_DN5553_c0_g1_i1.p2 TRINITY_DN5553_c0_g1~~TRINITY_DN5553_c0_g1_i1.p2  ORF type:complete len:216 (-),score=30.25 TRINITY_DN5553_c0_g1_i1:98-745(-)